MSEPESVGDRWRRWYEAIAQATPAHPKERRRRTPPHEPEPRQPVWTPEGEARRRLAELLAEADRARRGLDARWEQLTLPGWEAVSRRTGTARR